VPSTPAGLLPEEVPELLTGPTPLPPEAEPLADELAPFSVETEPLVDALAPFAAWTGPLVDSTWPFADAGLPTGQVMPTGQEIPPGHVAEAEAGAVAFRNGAMLLLNGAIAPVVGCCTACTGQGALVGQRTVR
jgi:hypothetical protein